MAFRWRADDDLTLNAGLAFRGIRTSIAKKTIVRGVRIPCPPPPLDPRMMQRVQAADSLVFSAVCVALKLLQPSLPQLLTFFLKNSVFQCKFSVIFYLRNRSALATGTWVSNLNLYDDSTNGISSKLKMHENIEKTRFYKIVLVTISIKNLIISILFQTSEKCKR